MATKKQYAALSARRPRHKTTQEEDKLLHEQLRLCIEQLVGWGWRLDDEHGVLEGSKKAERGVASCVWIYPDPVHGWSVLLHQERLRGEAVVVWEKGQTALSALCGALVALAATPLAADDQVAPVVEASGLATTFAELARTRMKELGLTQQKLADRMGQLQPNVGKYLTNKHQPSLDTIMKWALALECSPRDLVPAQVPPSEPQEASATPGAQETIF